MKRGHKSSTDDVTENENHLLMKLCLFFGFLHVYIYLYIYTSSQFYFDNECL